MGTAEESSAYFDSVPNDPALAVLANRGHGLNRTLEAVEDVTSTCGCQLEALVVFVATNFTGSHIKNSFHGFEKAKQASPVSRETKTIPMPLLARTRYFPLDP
jgi:hypothetical protein